MSKNILFAFLFLMGAIPSIAQKNYQVQSPNRDIKVEVTVADKVTFAIVQDHSEVMNSAVSMTLQGGEVLGANPKVLKVTKTSVDKEIPSPFYKKDVVKDIYNEMQISFQGNYGLVFRVYNDGVAYRFTTKRKEPIVIADEEAVWQIINAAVRETLAKTGAVPLMDFDRDGIVEIPALSKGAVYSEPRAMSNGDYNPFREEYIDPTAPDPNVDFTGFDVPYDDRGQTLSDTAGTGFAPRAGMGDGMSGRGASGSSLPGGLRSAGSGFTLPQTPPAGEDFTIPSSAADGFEDFVSGSSFEVESDAGFGTSALEFIPSGATAGQQRLAVEGRPEFTDPLPLGGGYLAALLGGRFVVVDVRRARERILYEDYLKMLGNGSSVSQQLLFPERLVLSGDEYALLEENAVEFASLGFDIDFAGEGTIEVKGTPADMPADAVDQMVYDLLQAFSTPVSLADQRREKIAAVMARGGAKGIPRNMSRDEAAVLLAQLAATGNFSFSPSGKAITAEITPEDIRTKLG